MKRTSVTILLSLTSVFRVTVLAALTVAASFAQGYVYYVSPSGSDGNPGTQAAPWRTIQHAASTLVAGDTAILMDGTYTEGSIAFANDGAVGNTITIRAQN